MSEPARAEIAEIASELALAIHDVAGALRTIAYALPELASEAGAEAVGDLVGDMTMELDYIGEWASDLASTFQLPQSSVILDERGALTQAADIAEAVSDAVNGLKIAAQAAIRLGGEDAGPIIETLERAAEEASNLSRALQRRRSALPREGVE